MKFRIILLPGDWHVPQVRRFWKWVRISGGRISYEDAVMEIGKYALGATK